jgi:CRP-like cAMP-binding protein
MWAREKRYPNTERIKLFSHRERVRTRFFTSSKAKVKLRVVSEQGKEAVVAILGPGQFFGEACLNGHPLRIASGKITSRRRGLPQYGMQMFSQSAARAAQALHEPAKPLSNGFAKRDVSLTRTD